MVVIVGLCMYVCMYAHSYISENNISLPERSFSSHFSFSHSSKFSHSSSHSSFTRRSGLARKKFEEVSIGHCRNS